MEEKIVEEEQKQEEKEESVKNNKTFADYGNIYHLKREVDRQKRVENILTQIMLEKIQEKLGMTKELVTTFCIFKTYELYCLEKDK